VLEDHLEKVTEDVEDACEHAQRKPLAEMIKEVVEAFVDAKIARADESTSLKGEKGQISNGWAH
jgi:hypothetical protein